MLRMYLKYDIDMRKVPILDLPDAALSERRRRDQRPTAMTCVPENLYVAGEAAGGIHGRNRLMGNSLLDVIVFGRNAGKVAGAAYKDVKVGKLTLSHVDAYEKQLADAGVESDVVSPMLLPDYVRKF